MNQNNENFRPEQSNDEIYRSTVDANLSENDYAPQDATEHPLKSKKKIRPLAIVLISIASVLVLCLATAVALFLPLNEKAAFANTFETVLFDPTDLAKVSEIWAEIGMSTQINLDLPKTVTELQGNLNIGLNTAQTADGKSKINLLLKSDDVEYPVELIYDEETVALGGLCANDQYVILPRKNITTALDGSVLHPDSNSDYAMKQDAYDDLRRAAAALDPEAREDSKPIEDSFNLIAEQIRPYLEPETSIAFADGALRLRKDVTYTLDTAAINDILDIVIDEAKDNPLLNENFSLTMDDAKSADKDKENDLARDLEQLKEQFDEMQIELTYTVSSKKVTDFRLSMSAVNKDGEKSAYDLSVKFVYGEDENGFDVSLITLLEEDQIKTTVESEVEYRKTVGDDETVCEAKIKTATIEKGKNAADPIVKNHTATLTYQNGEHKYHLCVKNEDISSDAVDIEGTFKIDRASATLDFSIDEITKGEKKRLVVRDFCEISFKKMSDKDAFDIPEGNDPLAMTNDEFTKFLRSLQVKKLDELAAALTGQSFGFSYTRDEYLLIPINESVIAAKKYCDQFSKYLTAEPIETRQDNAFVYDEELDLYILMDYSYTKKMIYYDFAYEMTEELLEKYHEATPTSSGSMTVHKLNQIELIPVTCTTRGKRIYRCELCDKTVEVEIHFSGHDYSKTLSVPVTTDDNASRTATVYCCKACGEISRCDIPNYCSFYVAQNDDGTYRLNDYVAIGTVKQICIPSELSSYLSIVEIVPNRQLSDAVISARIPNGVTKIQSETFYKHTQLQVLVIPSSVTTFEERAFSSTKPTVIYYCGTEATWNAIQMAEYRELWNDIAVVFCPDGVSAQQISDAVAALGTT